jgi:hypothetical protein
MSRTAQTADFGIQRGEDRQTAVETRKRTTSAHRVVTRAWGSRVPPLLGITMWIADAWLAME